MEGFSSPVVKKIKHLLLIQNSMLSDCYSAHFPVSGPSDFCAALSRVRDEVAGGSLVIVLHLPGRVVAWSICLSNFFRFFLRISPGTQIQRVQSIGNHQTSSHLLSRQTAHLLGARVSFSTHSHCSGLSLQFVFFLYFSDWVLLIVPSSSLVIVFFCLWIPTAEFSHVCYYAFHRN